MTNRAREAEQERDDSRHTGRGGLTPVTLFIVLVLFWIVFQMGSLLVTALMAVLLGTLLAAGPAWAGFEDGRRAYDQADYPAAYREWLPLAELGMNH